MLGLLIIHTSRVLFGAATSGFAAAVAAMLVGVGAVAGAAPDNDTGCVGLI